MIGDYIDPGERMAAMRFGALVSAAGIAAGRAAGDAMGKSAAASGTSGMASKATGILAPSLKGALAVAAITGVPFGIALHLIGNRLKAGRIREQELQGKIDLYRNAADQLGGDLE